jgi:hypothetical protein
MKDVDVDMDGIHWPKQCCRCGSKSFEIREHTQEVVLWSTGAVTKSQHVTLEIPVCGSCASSSFYWYGGAIALGGIGAAALQFNKPIALVLMLWIPAIVVAMIGVRQAPIKILKINPENGRLRIRLYNDSVAAYLRRKV